MNRAVAQRLGKRLVYEPMLVEERQAVEARTRDDHLEMVAATGTVLDAKLVRVRKRTAQKRFEAVGSHEPIVLTAAYP
jgi:cytochrome oxidase assembly protein ShyY1